LAALGAGVYEVRLALVYPLTSVLPCASAAPATAKPSTIDIVKTFTRASLSYISRPSCGSILRLDPFAPPRNKLRLLINARGGLRLRPPPNTPDEA
jgi:hypothetical protein